METKTKLRFVLMPFALAALVAPMTTACGEDPLGDVCCKDFKVGADISAVDWGLEGAANAKFGAFMQATGDFAASGTAMLSDVANACKTIAIDLGADPKSVTATEPEAQVKAWCDLAVAQIEAEVTGKGSVQIRFQPPECTLNVEAQGSCNAKCSAKAECEITPAEIVAQCDPAKLSGKCEANCTGTCEGSANLAVSCEGECSGTCEGQCQGTCSAGTGNDCAGSCEGTCTGKCRGSCKADANANVQCEGECTGGCEVELKAPKCKAEITPPEAECNASAECSGSCKASASAKAECKEPSLEIVATGSISAQAIGSLKLNLPKILAVFKARGQLMVQNAQLVADLGADISASGDFTASVKASACVVPAVLAIGDAVVNAKASVEASASVMGSLGVN